MAIGAVTLVNDTGSSQIELLASATALNNPPSGGSAGLSMDTVRAVLGYIPANVRIAANTTAGSGTVAVTLRLWGYTGVAWYVVKALNGGSSIAETGTDTIGYSEEVSNLNQFSRIYLEIIAIGGTSTAVTGYVLVGKNNLR